MKMQRVNFHLTNEQLAWLRGRQESTGVPVAEQIRRAIDKERAMNTKKAITVPELLEANQGPLNRLVRILAELGKSADIHLLTKDYAILYVGGGPKAISLNEVPHETPEDIYGLLDDILADLRDAWDAYKDSGARPMLWTENGVSTGVTVLEAGRYILTVDDSNGYDIYLLSELPDIELIPADEYDEDKALAEASDLEGYFGVVGVPGSIHHDFRWFDEKEDAANWTVSRSVEVLERNPALGDISTGVLAAADAFHATYRDGRRVYFQEHEAGLPGYEPKR